MSNYRNQDEFIGKRYGRLKVLSYCRKQLKNGKEEVYFKCICDCGNKKDVSKNNLNKGDTISCGCYRKERAIRTLGSHGGYGTKLYKILSGMKKRCKYESHPRYKNYGGRGIKVCGEWENDFSTFREWALNNGYKEGLTIDRIDNDGNYEPSNCRWATRREQDLNKSNTFHIKYKGSTKVLCEWSEITGINVITIKNRYLRGEKDLFKPTNYTRKTNSN